MTEYNEEPQAIFDSIADILSKYLLQSCIVGFICGVLAGAGIAVCIAVSMK